MLQDGKFTCDCLDRISSSTSSAGHLTSTTGFISGSSAWSSLIVSCSLVAFNCFERSDPFDPAQVHSMGGGQDGLILIVHQKI